MQCEAVAAKYPRQRIAALTMAGLFAMDVDRDLAIHALGEVFAERVEVADDAFLRKYAPMKQFRMRAGSGEMLVPLSRDLIGMRLVVLHMLAGQFGWAESAAAELNDTPVAADLRRQLAAVRAHSALPANAGRS
jgi:hypothetical protein